MKHGLLFAGLSGLAAAAAALGFSAARPGPAPAAPPAAAFAPAHPVVVELFTSQGCSSCPPADAVLARLAQAPNVVAISRAVTYWDRLGWKDTLGREANTELQRAYARRGGEGAGVYTPQAVVQGGKALVGAREAALKALILEAGRAPGPALEVAGGAATVRGTTARPAELRWIALTGHADVTIRRGENGGRTVRYTNVVRDERTLGAWSGGTARFALPGVRVAGADRYALVLQEKGAGRVLAGRFL